MNNAYTFLVCKMRIITVPHDRTVGRFITNNGRFVSYQSMEAIISHLVALKKIKIAII